MKATKIVGLTSTQIGALAENLLANLLMIESKGRLSPFQPIADDDGIDVLIFDKVTGSSLPIQVKARTSTIYKSGTKERGNIAHFEVRKTALKLERDVLFACILLNENMTSIESAWLIPSSDLVTIARSNESKFIIRASKSSESKDKYSQFRHASAKTFAKALIKRFDAA
jgi:hypothetical protein